MQGQKEKKKRINRGNSRKDGQSKNEKVNGEGKKLIEFGRKWMKYFQ